MPLLPQPIVEEVVEVFLGDRQITRRVEGHQVVIFQLLSCEVLCRVLAAVDAKQLAGNAQRLHRSFGRREHAFLPGHRAVLEAGALRKKEHPRRGAGSFLGGETRAEGERADQRRDDETFHHGLELLKTKVGKLGRETRPLRLVLTRFHHRGVRYASGIRRPLRRLAQFTKIFQRENAGVVAVAEGDSVRVRSDGLHPGDLKRLGFFCRQHGQLTRLRFGRSLLATRRARACVAKPSRGVTQHGAVGPGYLQVRRTNSAQLGGN